VGAPVNRPPRVPDVPDAFLTHERIEDVVRVLREQADALIAVADAIDAALGNGTVDTALAENADILKRGEERAADARAAAATYTLKEALAEDPEKARAESIARIRERIAAKKTETP